MVAYKSYNSLNNTWETVYLNGNSESGGTYIPQKQRTDNNFKLLQQTMANKQARFDANYQKIQNRINSILKNLAKPMAIDGFNVKITDRFNDNCINYLNTNKFDYSDNTVTDKAIKYLDDCLTNNIKNLFDEYDKYYANKSKSNKVSSTTNEKVNTSNNNKPSIINGGYKTNQILEYQYNSKTKKYDLIFDEKISSELFFKADSIKFKRGPDYWKGAKWSYQGFNEDNKQHIFFDDYNQTITFDKNFDIISWYAEPKDDVFQKVYIYKYLTKDDSVNGSDTIYYTTD